MTRSEFRRDLKTEEILDGDIIEKYETDPPTEYTKRVHCFVATLKDKTKLKLTANSLDELYDMLPDVIRKRKRV